MVGLVIGWMSAVQLMVGSGLHHGKRKSISKNPRIPCRLMVAERPWRFHPRGSYSRIMPRS
ncbi:MAG: hypothetical protein OXH50_14455 [Gemmatimonadetes bacterium]|nr:hypothetical protein [Gemmatimonadota bacterium]